MDESVFYIDTSTRLASGLRSVVGARPNRTKIMNPIPKINLSTNLVLSSKYAYSRKFLRDRERLLDLCKVKRKVDREQVLGRILPGYLDSLELVDTEKYLTSTPDPCWYKCPPFDPQEPMYLMYKFYSERPGLFFLSYYDVLILSVDDYDPHTIDHLGPVLQFLKGTLGQSFCVVEEGAEYYTPFSVMTITSNVAELILMMLAQNGDVINETFFESGISFLEDDDALYQTFVKVRPNQTYTREYSIYSVNDIFSDDPDMTYFDLIRSIPNIMHPGPTFAVPLTAIKMLPSDDILVQFPNNRSFIFQSSSYVMGSEVLITTDNKEFQDEVEGNLRIRSTSQGDKVQFKIIKGVDASYSQHRDFDIDKRVVLKFKSALFSYFDGNTPTETEGVFSVNGPLVFAPRNLLRYVYRRRNYTSDNDLMRVAYEVVYSVERQEMTHEQLIKTAIRLSQLQMTLMDIKHDFQEYISIFADLLSVNADCLNKNRKIQISFSDIWNHITTLSSPVIIPCHAVYYGKVHELFSYTAQMDNYRSVPSVDEIASFRTHMEAYNYDDKNMSDLLQDFISGKMRVTRAKNVILKFDFSIEKVPFVLRSADHDLDEYEQFFKHFIMHRMTDSDIDRCFLNAITVIKSVDVARRLFRIFSEKIFPAKIGANLVSMMIREVDPTVVKVDELLDHDISRCLELRLERQVAQRAQLEYQIFSSEFGHYSRKNVFNNAETVRQVYKIRRNQPTDAIFSDFFTKMKEKFANAKEGFEEVVKAQGTLRELNELWESKRDQVQSFLRLDNEAGGFIRAMDFSTFQSSIESAKLMINGVFYAALDKVAEVLGIDITPTLDLTTVLFYYIVWINTENKFLRYMMVLDLCSQLGIVDVVISLIRKVWTTIASKTPTDAVGRKSNSDSGGISDADDEENPDSISDNVDSKHLARVLKDIDNRIESIGAQATEKLDNYEEETDDVERPSEDFITSIIQFLEAGTPYILGLSAVTLLASFGLPRKGLKCKVVGEDIVQTCRNISFVGAGIAAVPKIYTHLSGVIYWVFDYIKKYVFKEHKTYYEFNSGVRDWCKNAAVFTASSGYLLVKSPELCLRYLELHSEMKKIQTRITDVHRDILMVYRDVLRHFTGLYELVRGTMTALFPLQEIFHVMITGEPGVGKTDLADEVIKHVKSAFTRQEIKNTLTIKSTKSRGAMLDILSRTSAFGDVYNMSESAKYMDNYFGQKLLRLDEVDAFGNLEPESYIRRLMILSGAPVASDQAALDNKGRMMTSKMMVSNSNNPYLNPDHMKDPSAMHRRRLLIRARFRGDLKSQLINHNQDQNKIIEEYCIKHGYNRTKSEHLVVDIMNNREKKVLYYNDVPLSGLTVPEAMAYISKECQLHYAKEWNRSVTKDTTKAVLSMYFARQMDASELNDIKILKLPNMSQELNGKLKEYADKYTESIKTTVEGLGHKWSDFESDVIKVVNARTSYFKHSINNPVKPETAKKEFDKGNGSNAVGSLKTLNKELDWDPVEKFYRIVDSIAPHPYSTEGIDFKRVKEDNTNGKVRFVYDGSIPTEFEGQAVLGELDYLNFIPLFAARARIERKSLADDEGTYIQRWKNDVKVIFGSLISISGSILSSVMQKVKEYVGVPILNGICIGIGLFAAIFSIGAAAALFMPTNALAYSSKRRENVINIPGMNASCDTNLTKKFAKNVVKVYNPVGEFFTAFGYRGNLFLTNTHNVENIKKNTYVHVANMNEKLPPKKMPFGPHCIKIIDGDIALILLVESYTAADISRHWATKHDLEKDMMHLRLSKASPILLRDPSIILDPTRIVQREVIVPHPQEILEPGSFTNTGIHPRHKTRMLNTIIQHGDSGSPVFHDNPRLSGSLFGLIHRKFDPYCLVACISKEEIEDAAVHFDAKHSIKVNFAETPQVMDQPINAVFKYDQVVKESFYPNQAISTAPGFKPTPLHGNFPIESFPAIQNNNDPRIPKGTRHHMEVSLNKGSGATYPRFSFEYENFAKEHLKSTYYKYHPEVISATLYTTKEAITGVPIPGSTSIEKGSCAGLPYKLTAKKGKDPYIKTGPNGETLIANSVFMDVENYEDHYKYNSVPYNTKLEFRKLELVGQNKIDNPKTRTVGMGNMIHWICYNKLFKDLFTIVKTCWNNGSTSPFALGLDFERHWHMIAEHLKYTDYVIEFDVKAWDSNISLRTLFMAAEVKLDILKNAAKARNQEFDPDIEKIAYGLCVDFAVTDVCYEEIIYEKSSGLLSGHPGTFMENSEIHEMILAMACKTILDREAPQYSNSAFIHEHVKSIKAADDILIAVSPLARKYITAQSMKEAYEAIGLEVTAADKSLRIEPKRLEDAQFLKTGFRLHQGIYFPVPNLSIIHQLLNYVRTDSKLSRQEQLTTNFGNAMRFAFWRGPVEYENLRQKVNMLCAKNKINFYWDFDYQYMAAFIKHQALLRANRENMTEPVEENSVYIEALIDGFF